MVVGYEALSAKKNILFLVTNNSSIFAWPLYNQILALFLHSSHITS